MSDVLEVAFAVVFCIFFAVLGGGLALILILKIAEKVLT